MFLFNSKENIPPSFQSGNIREKIPLDPKSFIRVYIQIPDKTKNQTWAPLQVLQD